MKRTIATLWVCVPAVAGMATRPSSPATWVLLTLAAVIPPAIVTYLWRDPVTSTSERIQEALR